MEISTINTLNNNSNARYNNYDFEIVSPSEVGTLDKYDFLQMILVQLQNQDPLNPLDNSEFASQLAQFSTLEQMTNMSSQLNSLGDISKQLGEILDIIKNNDVSGEKQEDSSKKEENSTTKIESENNVTLHYTFNDEESTQNISNSINKLLFNSIYSK